jgi:hypothetical protein
VIGVLVLILSLLDGLLIVKEMKKLSGNVLVLLVLTITQIKQVLLKVLVLSVLLILVFFLNILQEPSLNGRFLIQLLILLNLLLLFTLTVSVGELFVMI